MNAVEARVNEKLRENLAVTTQEMKFDDAIALGAMHLFGEKYGDIVRVVSIGEDGWSRELCGGTHIDHVGKIGAINIMSEASIGSGVRRVDAVVGQGAYEFNAREHALVSQLSDMVNARPDELAERVNMLLAKLKESDRRLCDHVRIPALRLPCLLWFPKPRHPRLRSRWQRRTSSTSALSTRCARPCWMCADSLVRNSRLWWLSPV